ncbi:MerR family transcriptional regulator [Nonomuraea muscovyensis]|uniref:DNA-binding transcriptional MerR regulator n=1 Tax=Nonomuraea muscovyensis TaxID=1124761 RepID=A0A7X0C1X8_9ACTN|nr:MerR family transcriptional regulator [Nonomuraea muscovyensis]MBB6346933.1 DNA-binding transcriptional MerR regulator [Nonomuraea muscovyensis]
MSNDADGLSIGQVAERTGLSVHALRFYEREGILTRPVRRAAGGRRVYTEQDVEWLLVCVILRASGMPLPAIREYARMMAAGPGNEASRLELLRRHRQEVTTQLELLGRSLDLIEYKVRVYEDILEHDHGCAPLAEPTCQGPSAVAG